MPANYNRDYLSDCIAYRHTSPEGWSVSVGHTRLAAFNEFGQDRGLREIRLHPQHEIVELEFDIALMRLDKPVQFTRYVAPVCLPPAGLSLSDNNTCYVAGWGKPHSGGTVAVRARHGELLRRICFDHTKIRKYPKATFLRAL